MLSKLNTKFFGLNRYTLQSQGLIKDQFTHLGFRPFSTLSSKTNFPDPGNFDILEDPRPNDTKLPQFLVGKKNGFLPRAEPLADLPSKFDKLESLLNRMPLTKTDQTPGLLSRGEFGDAVLKELPVYDVSNIEDTRLISALFRDYTFMASSYLLEPCDLNFRKTGEYGLGRTTLPKSISIPLWKLAEKIKGKPFMEYALSYALYNWARIDPKGPLTYENLRLIRTFEGGLSEHGFIITHVTMVAHTGDMVTAVDSVFKAVEQKDSKALLKAFSDLLSVTRRINDEMETMWLKSKPQDYIQFRTFIMGIKNQPMFPKGVVYEGISDQPQAYRGESGANDSIVPTLDNLLELTAKMPKNPLTEILKDFRTYRPSGHNEYVSWVEQKAKHLGVKQFALSNPETALLYLALLDQDREFRQRHWLFTKSYIIAHTTHPVATGGSPIVTWLPNQLGAVLDTMIETCHTIDDMAKTKPLHSVSKVLKDDLEQRTATQKRILEREVEELRKRFPNQDKAQVYN